MFRSSTIPEGLKLSRVFQIDRRAGRQRGLDQSAALDRATRHEARSGIAGREHCRAGAEGLGLNPPVGSLLTRGRSGRIGLYGW
jgi:hypothetical protein